MDVEVERRKYYNTIHSKGKMHECKCVEPAHNRSSWELTYTVAKKIEEKRSMRERME
jgi:hypothetical protein